MAKWQNDLMLDAALDYIINNAATLLICSSQPADRAAALAAALADVAIDSADFSKANGDTSGRKATVAAQNGVAVDTSGNGNHLAIISASALLYVTTCTEQALTAGNTVNIPAWDIELADPA